MGKKAMKKTPLSIIQDIAEMRSRRKAAVQKKRDLHKEIYNLSLKIEDALDELTSLS